MNDFYNCHVGAWQSRLLTDLFCTLFAMRGRVNFTNLARYCERTEQSFRRHFERAFDWPCFNGVIVRAQRRQEEPLIGVFDCSFLPKSGTRTYGLDRFFSSKTKRPERGLEVSILGVVATKTRRAFALDATQTPAGLSSAARSASAACSASAPSADCARSSDYSRIDVYTEQIRDLRAETDAVGVSHWVGDGYYAKRKVFDALEEADAYFVTRLRGDATLRYLYSGPNKSGPGAPKQYDGKINWHDPSQLTERFDEAGSLEDQPHVRVLTTLANSPHLKRTLRVVLLLDERNGRSVVLCSTDLEQAAEEIVRYYRLRYQIEFVIRDAKQHTGLGHCQARSQEKLDFHMNMSLAGVNLLRYVAARSQCTLTDYCRLAYNRVIVLRLLAQLGLGAESALIDPRLSPVLELGRMAA